MLVNLPPIEEAPAAYLEGRVLGNGWRVVSRIEKGAGATGGHFSITYLVEHPDLGKAFMKALNFHAVVDAGGSLADRINSFTSAYIFERDLLKDCCDQKLSHVIRLLDHGDAVVHEAGPILSQVPYLIFELADGDIRTFQALLGELDCAWAFRVMKHVLQGIGQLHSAQAAHQDLKPSNVLTQDGGTTMKLGDLGRADRRGVQGPSSELPIPGAVTYAPPEQHYGAFRGGWEERKAADLYLAGSLGVQLFLGNCMSALLLTTLPPQLGPRQWSGSFEDVLPYLQAAHETVMMQLEQEVRGRTQSEQVAREFSVAVAQMTNPSPLERGHPRYRLAKHANRYSVERFVSILDLLSKRIHAGALGVR